jgi:hypothetical protein
MAKAAGSQLGKYQGKQIRPEGIEMDIDFTLPRRQRHVGNNLRRCWTLSIAALGAASDAPARPPAELSREPGKPEDLQPVVDRHPGDEAGAEEGAHRSGRGGAASAGGVGADDRGEQQRRERDANDRKDGVERDFRTSAISNPFYRS